MTTWTLEQMLLIALTELGHFSFSKGKWKVKVLFSHVDSLPPWTVAHQAPLSMEFSRPKYWSGLSFPPPGDRTQVSCTCRQTLCQCATWEAHSFHISCIFSLPYQEWLTLPFFNGYTKSPQECLLLFNGKIVSDSLQPHGLYSSRLICPWDSPGKNIRVGCHALL